MVKVTEKAEATRPFYEALSKTVGRLFRADGAADSPYVAKREGKNALFITPEFGSKVRLVTVLTDMPLKAEKPIQEPKCGSCEICKNACPAQAITGKLYEYGAPRSTIFDARRCSEHMKTYKDIGRGAVCGLCMRACPYNQRKTSHKEEPSLD